MTKTPVKKAVFPVGGLGTRFLPATKSMPKEMLPIVDKPLIQYAFEEARDAGIEEFIFITGRNKNIISNHFDHVYELQKVLDEKAKAQMLSQVRDWLPDAGNIAFIRQQQPLGLGHAVYCARNFVGDEPFAVLLADELFIADQPPLAQMLSEYNASGGNIIGVADIDNSETSSYGIVDTNGEQGEIVTITGMVEKPSPEQAPSNIAIIGRYILQPQIFDHLDKRVKGADGEIQLTDAIAAMIADTPTSGVHIEGQRFDCGNKHGFLEANIAFALAREDMREDVLAILEKHKN